MTKKDEKDTFITTRLETKATAAVEEGVAKDLEVPDPTKEDAKAAIAKAKEKTDV